METPNTDMLRGRVDIFVLKALSENDGYGYDILNYIHERTEGHYEMKQSSIYSVLKRLEKQGYVYSYAGEESNGAKRRYYSLTENGKKLLEDEENEWAYTRTLLDNLVSSREFDLKTDTPPFRPSDLRPMTKRAPRGSETSDENEAPSETNIIVDSSSTEMVADSENGYTQPQIIVQNITFTSSSNTAEQQSDAETNSQTVQASADNSIDKTPASPNAASEEAEKSDCLYEIAQQNERTEAFDDEFVLHEEPEPKNEALEINDNVDRFRDKKPEFSVKENYRDFFGNLFANNSRQKNEARESVVAATTAPEFQDIDCSHINDLRIHLNDEGIKLKSFEPSNAHKSSLRYLMVNKLFRDSVILSYLFLIVTLLIVSLCKPFAVSLNAVLIIGGVFLIIPVISLLLYINNPNKKIKDNINIKIILAISCIVYLAFFIVNLIVSLIIPNGLSLNSPATYAPCIICLVVPFFGAILSILYKTNNYHLKNTQ